MNYRLYLHLERGWLETQDAIVRGAAFISGVLVQRTSLAEYFAEVVNCQQLMAKLSGLNGFYAVVL